MSTFTEEQKNILDNYVTNTDDNIFAVKNLQGIVGAVYARYSRAKLGFRETLLKEFVEEGHIDAAHADQLIERVLVAYGDDSVGELEGAHVSFEDISTLATKEIEDRRIGGSPIEKSTRYVFFDEKDEKGEYKYVREPSIMASSYAEQYTTTLDVVFDTYKRLIEPMQAFYQSRYPIEEASYDVLGTGEKQMLRDLSSEKDIKAFTITHKIDLKTKACDTLRCLLPLATKTNVGMFGNGRYFQTLISHLISTPYPEVVAIGEKTQAELAKIIKQYVRRSKRKDYNINIDREMTDIMRRIYDVLSPPQAYAPVTLIPAEICGSDDGLIAHMLYQYAEHSFMDLYHMVERMNPALKAKIKDAYVGNRQTRRDRPGRAFEAGYTYTLDLTADYGTYKDLMRHRMTTQIRQTFSPRHGFIVPKDLLDAGFERDVLACHDRVLALYNDIARDLGPVASYLTLHGHRIRWIMGFNDREAMHLLELRTGRQGHPQYRKLCQEIHRAIEAVDPWRAGIMTFVDHNDYASARGDSEARQRVKEQELEKKYVPPIPN